MSWHVNDTFLNKANNNKKDLPGIPFWDEKMIREKLNHVMFIKQQITLPHRPWEANISTQALPPAPALQPDSHPHGSAAAG